MKRLQALALVVFILASSAATASAARFSSLSLLQKHLERHSPEALMASGPHHVEMQGRILELHWCGENNHHQMTLQIDDPAAMAPIGAEGPQLIVHFRLHKDAPPFSVGDTVTVSGSLNALYSSVMVPWILAETINGSDDF